MINSLGSSGIFKTENEMVKTTGSTINSGLFETTYIYEYTV